MLSLRARIFAIISLIVLLILGISLFLLVGSKDKNSPTDDKALDKTLPTAANGTVGNSSLVTTNLENIKVPKLTTLEVEQKAVQNLAKIFVERLNSYSSESRYQNMRDVENLTTANYWKQLSAKIPANIPAPGPNFYAVSVEAYSAKLSDWTDKSANVDLQLKITEEKGGVITKKDAQAKVSLVKNGGSWLVDNFTMVK